MTAGAISAAAAETGMLQRIAGRLPYLPAAMQRVGEFVLRSPEAVQSMSITSLAAAVGVAESTVSRFAREMDVGSYPALRLAIAEARFATRAADRPAGTEFIYEGIVRDDGLPEIVGKIQRSALQAIGRTASAFDERELGRAVDAIDRAGTLVFSCMGSSSIAAEEGVMRFTRAGKRCMLFRDHSLQAMSAAIIGPEDTLIAISDSGHSTTVVDVVHRARSRGSATIAITSGVDSPLAKAGEITLFTASVPSGGALYGESVTSKWGQILAVDVLYAAYAARHFDQTLEHLSETYAAGIQHSRS